MSSARVAALRLLTRRDYTTAELRAKLADREYAEDDIADAIRTLTADRLLDDRRAAASHLRASSQIKGRGRLRIQRELEARGLDRGLVRDTLANLPLADETAAIERFLQRKHLPNPVAPSDRRRLFQQLLRRGFPADAISKALRGRTDKDED